MGWRCPQAEQVWLVEAGFTRTTCRPASSALARPSCEEHRPRGIGDRLCQFRVLDHVGSHQRLDCHQAKPLDEAARFLLNEVLAPIGSAFMDVCHHFALVRSLCAALGHFGQLALSASKGCLFGAEKAGIGNLFSC
jgi:hypothetical protein